MRSKLLMSILIIGLCGCLAGCKHADDDIKSSSLKETVEASYKDVSLDWSTNTFSHNSFLILIPEEWGAGILGKRLLPGCRKTQGKG